MNTTGLPKKQPVPFGVNGQREDLLSTTPAGDNTASYDAGFPPVTMILKAAGGLPPKGQDMNQILFELSAIARWMNAGASYPFDATFASAVGGYPKGAVIPNSTGTGYWLNQTENNSSNPEASATVNTGWVPAYQYGTTAITGLAATSYTLTTLQAAKPRITLAGTLTGNIALYFPTWQSSWTVVNNCTGAFSVTCKTPSGTGVSIPSGTTRNIYGDGTNIQFDLGSAAYRDVGTGANQIPDSSSFVYGTNGNGAYRTMPGAFQLCRNLVTVSANSTYTWTFPLAFTATPGVYYSSLNPASSASSAMWFNGVSTTSCSIFNPNSIAISVNVLAIF